jgi:hypothetical protein
LLQKKSKKCKKCKKSKKAKNAKNAKNAGSFFCKPRESVKKEEKAKAKVEKNLRFYRLKLGLAVSALSLTFFSRKPFSVYIYFYYYERPKNVERPRKK